MEQQIFQVVFKCGTDIRHIQKVPALNELIALSIAMNSSSIQGSWCQLDQRFSVDIKWLGTYSDSSLNAGKA